VQSVIEDAMTWVVLALIVVVVVVGCYYGVTAT
jgi:hypothetical protein